MLIETFPIYTTLQREKPLVEVALPEEAVEYMFLWRGHATRLMCELFNTSPAYIPSLMEAKRITLYPIHEQGVSYFEVVYVDGQFLDAAGYATQPHIPEFYL